MGRQHADTGRSVFGLWRPEDEAEIAISFHQGLESTEKPTLSPDGAWIAYTSSVSGSREVFVLPAEGDAARPKQLSINGGDDPLWDSKGDRIFYRNGNAVLEVAVEHSGRFVAHEPSPLFAGDYAPVGHRSWQRSNHDDRFLMLKSMEGTSEMPRPTEVAFVRNWLTSVDRRDKDNIGRTNT